MKPACLWILFSFGIVCQGCSQANTNNEEFTKKGITGVGGNCEGCEAIYESRLPFKNLQPTDTLPDFFKPGPKIVISGTIYKADGHTPAKDVVLYIYHTDQSGKYTPGKNAAGWERRHGALRGWIKTDQNGFYRFYTLVPASYPNSRNPKHIHPVIKESGINEYYIDEFLFADDPLLPADEQSKLNPRGGNGVLKTYVKNGVLHATRDIILGLNIPGYPKGLIKQ